MYRIAIILLVTSCSAPVVMGQQDKHEHMSAVQELRYELADVKHALHHAEVEIQLLEEQLHEQEKKTSTASSKELSVKIQQLEATQKQLKEELKTLAIHTEETSAYVTKLETLLVEYKNALACLGDLKSALLSSPTKSYRVKQGDSLERIAKAHKISVKALRECNQLQHDKIFIGQELLIPE